MGIDSGVGPEDAVPLLLDLSDVILHVPSLAKRASAALSELILQRFDAQVLCYNEIRLDERSATTPVLHSHRPPRHAVSPRLADMLCDHPLVAHYARTGLDEPLLITDVCSRAEWERTEIAVELSHQFGVRDQITIPTSVGPTRVCAWVVMRDVPFEDRHREPARELRTLLRGVRSPPTPTPRSTDHHHERGATSGDGATPTLTPREIDVLGLLGDGLTGHAIGHRLAISPATVDKHLQHIYRKLGVRDRLAAVLIATGAGLIPPTGAGAETSSGQRGATGPTGA
ncbi:MAG: helix-turn-helix transcriptional regulator [Dermatophilaceae bacterium]